MTGLLLCLSDIYIYIYIYIFFFLNVSFMRVMSQGLDLADDRLTFYQQPNGLQCDLNKWRRRQD